MSLVAPLSACGALVPVAVAIAQGERPSALVVTGMGLALAGAVLVFAGLLVSYALAVTTGLPVLHPEPEPVEGLALATKAIEAAGLLAAWTLVHPLTKGTPTWHGTHVRSRSS
jgi:hypothetical protein